MNIVEGSVTLSELARELHIGSATLRQHIYKNRGGIAENISKFGDRKTGDYLVDVHSVLTFIEWARSKARKINDENLSRVEEEIKAWLRRH